MNGIEWPYLCYSAVKKLNTHSPLRYETFLMLCTLQMKLLIDRQVKNEKMK